MKVVENLLAMLFSQSQNEMSAGKIPELVLA